MERRLVLFLVFSVVVLLANASIQRWLNPPKPKPVAQQQADAKAKAEPGKAAEGEPGKVEPAEGEAQSGDAAAAGAEKPEGAPDEAKPDDGAVQADPNAVAARPEQPLKYLTLGSLDPKSGYKMLVTLVTRGAACERIELNNPKYRDSEFDGGYLGHLALTSSKAPAGAVVGVVGKGTPADVAGVQVGDIITAVGDKPVTDRITAELAFAKLNPRDKTAVTVSRGGQSATLQVTLGRKPVDIVRPEPASPLSFEMTLAQLDDQKLAADKSDLPGEPMSRGNWELVSHDETQATFRWPVPASGIDVVKRYRLVKAGEGKGLGATVAYHLVFDVEIVNTSEQPRKVAYRLGGPTGLPTEGWWYASKISRQWWSGLGIRDVVVATQVDGRQSVATVSQYNLAQDKELSTWKQAPVLFAGVDALYFASMVIPQKKNPDDVWFADLVPRRVGPVPTDKSRIKLTDVSYQATSITEELKPKEGTLKHSFVIFAGPKTQEVLAAYGLQGIVYFGWPIFAVVSQGMLSVLHFFHDSLHLPYAMAIVLLTVCVRSAMFPLSRRQALSAQKMQELAPEMKKLAEKHKNNLEARSRAQQELFRKHNYNPLAGCLPMFIQLPIFIGLYRSLSVDVELRGAPLISDSIRWASNLAAPDQLFSWETWMPAFGQSWLGPFFNLLPCITIALFIWQQKMFMPPPTDEQAALQYKMMQYMMIFMGVMFFKVPSGLCVYFIASSIWGIAERKLLPKTIKKPAAGSGGGGGGTTINVPSRPAPDTNGSSNGSSGGKKQRSRK